MEEIGIIALLLVVFPCKTNPSTRKSTLNFMLNSRVFLMAFSQCSASLQLDEVTTDTNDTQMVKRVGERITKAAKLWLDTNSYKGYLDDYRWEYNLVGSSEANAWYISGGKIVVYVDILPITKNEVGLAVVVGHEVAHALVDYGAQRMSAGTLQQVGVIAGSLALRNSRYAEYTDQFMMAYGLGSNLGMILPFNRSSEIEADAIDIQVIVIAGYDLSEVSGLQKRVSAKKNGVSTSSSLSTRPSGGSHIRNLTQLALKARTKAAKFGVTNFK